MWGRKNFTAGVIGCAALITMVTSGIVSADGTGYAFDFAPISFQYVVGAGPGGKVGTITINDNSDYGSLMSLAKLELGADGVVGGGGANADTNLDLAKNIDADTFDVSVVGDVIKLAANDYRIEGTIRITDTASTLSDPKVLADFVSNTVSLNSSRFFFFEGDLATAGSNDALLLPASSSGWTYEGVAAVTPSSPNEDGVVGRVTQSSGRATFTMGQLNGGFLAEGIDSLDTFFGQSRASTAFDVQAVVVPEPITLVLGVLGLGWFAGRRR